MIRCALAAVFGLMLMAAPGVLDYDDPAASFHYVMGPLIVSFSVMAIWEAIRGSRLVNLPLAAAVIIVTPVLALEVAQIATALVAGIGSGVLSALPDKVEDRYGGGWRMLLDRDKSA